MFKLSFASLLVILLCLVIYCIVLKWPSIALALLAVLSTTLAVIVTHHALRLLMKFTKAIGKISENIRVLLTALLLSPISLCLLYLNFVFALPALLRWSAEGLWQTCQEVVFQCRRTLSRAKKVIIDGATIVATYVEDITIALRRDQVDDDAEGSLIWSQKKTRKREAEIRGLRKVMDFATRNYSSNARIERALPIMESRIFRIEEIQSRHILGLEVAVDRERERSQRNARVAVMLGILGILTTILAPVFVTLITTILKALIY